MCSKLSQLLNKIWGRKAIYGTLEHSIMYTWASLFPGEWLVAGLFMGILVYIYILAFTLVVLLELYWVKACFILSANWTLVGNPYVGKCYYCYYSTKTLHTHTHTNIYIYIYKFSERLGKNIYIYPTPLDKQDTTQEQLSKGV